MIEFWKWLTFVGWQQSRAKTTESEKRILPKFHWEIKEVPGKGYLVSIDDKDLIFKNKKHLVKYLYKRLQT